MRLQIVSWGGDTTVVHEGATFKAWLPDESTGHFSQVAANVSFLKQQGATPTFLGQTPNEWYFPLAIQIVDKSEAGHSSDRDILAGLFPISAERNQEKILLVKDIDDSDKQWQITGTPITFNFDKTFVRIIIAVAEPRWIETDEQSDSNNYTTGSAVTLVPEPKGNTEFDPILEITPSEQRGVGHTGDELAHFIQVLNRDGQPALSRFAIELSDGGWNHATDVTASDSLANADDIRVEVNRRVVNRWIADPDTASTKIWTYIDLPTTIDTKLGVALGVGSSETEVQLVNSLKQLSLMQRMPSSGQFVIGTERFTYTGKIIDIPNLIIKFKGVKRAVLQSTKAAHSIGDTINWIPNQIWVYQGNTTVLDPPTTEDVADFEPAFDISTSTNVQWNYDTVFFDEDSKRGWGWFNRIRELRPPQDNVIQDESIVFTDNEGTFANPATVLGQRIATVFNPWSGEEFSYIYCGIFATIEIPFGVKAVTVEGRKAQDGSTWVVNHSLHYSRGGFDGWRRKWNDTTMPSVDTVWEDLHASIEATLHTLDATDGYRYILFLHRGTISGGSTRRWDAWQIDKCTLDFNATEVPLIVDKFIGVGAGAEVVEIQFVVTNSATGDSIQVNASIELNETLILNFQTFDFYTLSDNLKFPISVRPTGDITGHWFRLLGGVPNQIKIVDANMPATVLNVIWNARHL